MNRQLYNQLIADIEFEFMRLWKKENLRVNYSAQMKLADTGEIIINSSNFSIKDLKIFSKFAHDNKLICEFRYSEELSAFYKDEIQASAILKRNW